MGEEELHRHALGDNDEVILGKFHIDDDEPRRWPSKLWRNKYACKKLKGPHEFVLIKPEIWSWIKEINNLSVEEYYKKAEENYAIDKGAFRGVIYYWECCACGKRSYKFNDKSKPKK